MFSVCYTHLAMGSGISVAPTLNDVKGNTMDVVNDSLSEDFFEEDESLEEIVDRFERGEKGTTICPPGGQVVPSQSYISIWPNSGYVQCRELNLVA